MVQIETSSSKSVHRESNIMMEMNYGGFWIRMLAAVLDSLVLQAVFIGFNAAMGIHFFDPPFVVSVFQTIIALAYYIILTVMYGQTLGKMATGIKVVQQDDRSNGWGRIIVRETIGKFISAIILCIGFIIIAFDREKRGLHDHLCNTRVVKMK